MKIGAIIFLFLALFVAAATSGCAHRGGPQGGFGAIGGFSLPVAAEPLLDAERSRIPSTSQSAVTPLQQASLSSVVSGNVLSVTHQIGERVHQGELFVKIDDSTLRAQLAQKRRLVLTTCKRRTAGARNRRLPRCSPLR